MPFQTREVPRPGWLRPSVLLTALIMAICLILLWQAFTVAGDVDPAPTVRTTTQPAEVWPEETTTTGESLASP